MTSPFDVFLASHALHINRARLDHLASLGLGLHNKRVLEVGAGIGLHTAFFEERGCDVLSTDGSSANVAEMMRRNPHRRVGLLDLDRDVDLTELGSFDVIYCYGTLYHLSFPDRALARLAAACTGMILLETIVLPGSHPELQLAAEPPSANQALRGFGCRPTRPWVMAALQRHFGHAYTTLDQPDHPDFITDWSVVDHEGNLRAVFVGSKQPLVASSLTNTLPVRHRNSPLRPRRRRYSRVWLDVGAPHGEHSMAAATNDPTLQVHAFEPRPDLHSKLMLAAPSNVTVHAMAVSDRDGFAACRVDRFGAASSLLPVDAAVRSGGADGDLFPEERAIVVPTIRLDTFMRDNGIATVDCLKIGAQDADFSVIRSLGDRIGDVRRIQHALAPDPRQLHRVGADEAAIVAYLAEHGFVLEATKIPPHGREGNLTFASTSAPAQIATHAEHESEQITGLYDVRMHAVVAGSVRQSDNALEVTTAAAQWAYAAAIPIDRTRIPQGRIVRLALNLRVDRGALQVGVLNTAETQFIATVTGEAGPSRTMELAVYRPERMGRLVVANASAEGGSHGWLRLLETSCERPEPLDSDGT
jgi:FkbM family methyltransferase